MAKFKDLAVETIAGKSTEKLSSELYNSALKAIKELIEIREDSIKRCNKDLNRINEEFEEVLIPTDVLKKEVDRELYATKILNKKQEIVKKKQEIKNLENNIQDLESILKDYF